MSKEIKDKIVAIDFDGVLATYGGFKGIDVFGDPIPEAIKATQVLKEKGYYIIIFTTRLDSLALRQWLKDNKVAYDEINRYKNQPPCTSIKPIWHCYIGDRTLHFDTKMGWCNSEVIVKSVERIIKEAKGGF